MAMIPSNQRRAIRAIAVLAVIFALLLLLVPHSNSSHAAQLLWLTLVPVFLFAIADTESSLWLPVEANHPTKRRQPTRSAQFQRPPPSRLA
jgi:hypothetical protein